MYQEKSTVKITEVSNGYVVYDGVFRTSSKHFPDAQVGDRYEIVNQFEDGVALGFGRIVSVQKKAA